MPGSFFLPNVSPLILLFSRGYFTLFHFFFLSFVQLFSFFLHVLPHFVAYFRVLSPILLFCCMFLFFAICCFFSPCLSFFPFLAFFPIFLFSLLISVNPTAVLVSSFHANIFSINPFILSPWGSIRRKNEQWVSGWVSVCVSKIDGPQQTCNPHEVTWIG